MAIQNVDLGTHPTGEGGDSPRSGFDKVNKNFTELAASIKAVNDEKLGKNDNAVSTFKWQTARTTSFSGAATGSFSTDGSKDSSCILTLANSGVVAGTFGSTIEIPVLTIDAKGLTKVAKNQPIRSASTTQTGIVQLADALNDTSPNKGLTANQGKLINDRLNNAGVFTKAPTLLNTQTDLLADVPDVCQTFTLSGTYTNAPSIFGNGSITGMIDVKKRWFEAGVQKILTIRHLSGQIWENVKNGETWGGWKRIDAIDKLDKTGGEVTGLTIFKSNIYVGQYLDIGRGLSKGTRYLTFYDSNSASKVIGNISVTEAGAMSFGKATSYSFDKTITGNIDTADKLKTARKINKVSFNGESDITIKPDAEVIPSNADLNTYLEQGPFYCDSNAQAQTIKNMPPSKTQRAFHLDVKKTAGLIQEVSYYSGSTGVAVEIWVRGINESKVIGKWECIAYQSSDITGNAATATKLQKPFKVHGIETDGSNDIDIPTFSGSSTGLVPAATTEDANKVLSGAGIWVNQSSGGSGPDAETAKKLVKPDGTNLITYSLPTSDAPAVNLHAKRLYFVESGSAIWVSAALVMTLSTITARFNVGLDPQSKERYSLGSANYTWKDCYLLNAPIVTSDLNAKTDIVDIDAAEKACAIDLRKCIKKYKLKSAVAEKGGVARYHFGVIAQEVVEVFEQHGLDVFNYGIVCRSEWGTEPAEIDEDGRIIKEAVEVGSAYAVRYDELSMFLLAAL